ncbi:MAG: hypothetical protein AVDCRST_MAG70-1090 [uncultured Thermomicrobiales bacterium]|uniref:Uncharacterized protein n=1 Tax=uncultured Thermomicrobiales bacterium TaxID=1645740 RepID=A0A6J4UPG1_9BACT|nr:MAG: hypothetical protein AVDCRST_MAG70-1090 [uncultured Thermomicrobiales bacterium]
MAPGDGRNPAIPGRALDGAATTTPGATPMRGRAGRGGDDA